MDKLTEFVREVDSATGVIKFVKLYTIPAHHTASISIEGWREMIAGINAAYRELEQKSRDLAAIDELLLMFPKLIALHRYEKIKHICDKLSNLEKAVE